MLHFAVAGSPKSTPSPGGTLLGFERTAKLGITAMELEWVQRVPGNIEHVEEIGRKARELHIVLTIHAPYYVNLNAKEEEKILASKMRIIHALTMGQLCGARSVCVHPAFYLGDTPKKAYENVRRATEDILKQKKRFFPDVNLAYETMGKPTQFGTLQEVLELSREFDLYPCLDPAHMHARENGAWNTEAEWHELFDQYQESLGERSLKHVHLHYSGILYGLKGERKHLPLGESDAKWRDFVKVLSEREIEGVVVCESPIQEVDTLLMKKEYESSRKK